jgi:Tfp pilus assembly protein PilV
MCVNGRSWRTRLAGEAGIGLVEVMVSAVVMVLVATATVSSIAESQKTSTRTLSRGAIANLAEQDQERMRSLRTKDLADYSETRTVTQQNATYRVDSKGEFVQDSTGDVVSCTSTGAQTTFLRLTSTVTPTNGFRAEPLTVRSIVALPITQYSPTSGTLIVPISTAAGTAQTGVTVAISGPESRTATLNSMGCAIFQFLTPGAYQITLNQAGFVDQSLNQNYQYSGTVSPGTINTATPQLYDRAGGIRPTFDGDTTTLASNISVSHASIATAPTTRTFPVGGATGLFPFTTPYAVYSGNCAANDPTIATNDGPTFYSAHPGFGQAQIQGTSPATTTPVDLHEPTITLPKVSVKWQDTSGGQKDADLPIASGNTTKLYLKPADSGCTLASNPTITVTDSTGTPMQATVDLPYGTYKICAEYNKTKPGQTNKTGTYSQVGPTIANTKFNGPGVQPDINIDTQAKNTAGTPGLLNQMACSARSGF